MAKQDGKNEEGAPASADSNAAPTPKSGLMAWLPLLVTLVAMPALAYAVTSFVLVPKLRHGLAIEAAGEAPTHGSEGGENGGHGTGGHGPAKKASGSEKVSLSKLLVNVSGTMGSRFLLASVTIVGGKPGLEASVEKHEAQLRHVACGLLAAKTIGDLEKPGSRNVICAELLSSFNQILGGGAVQEIFLTEFAIQ